MPNVKRLPQEIWWLVAEELVTRRDFDSLYIMAQVSKDLALLALPLLYSIHEHSPICSSEGDLNLPRWAGLWRSLIKSSMGQTYFPYCLWVKSLRLGNLFQLLEDLASLRDYPISVPGVRTAFFAPPLDEFHILNTTVKMTRAKAPRAQVMNLDAIVAKVADKVTEFVKTSADDQDKTVALNSLEGYHLPAAKLTTWISRVSNLTSLTVRDGSVLNASVGQSIRESCPAFKEVCCYFCKGTDLDQDLAGFLLGLAPNTLESFTILSLNDIGAQSLAALNEHAESLKRLKLYLESTSLQGFEALKDCKALESLALESGSSVRQVDWETEFPGVFEQVVDWLKQCPALSSMEAGYIPSSASLLAKVLKEPRIKLKALIAKMPQATQEFYAALGNQIRLEELTIVTDEEPGDFEDARHKQFMDAVCNCPELRDLFVKSEMMALDDIVRITQTATKLEDFRFNGEIVGDDYLVALTQLRWLKSLNILAPSYFTMNGLLKFIRDLASHPDAGSAHNAISILVTQLGEHKFTESQENRLLDEIRKRLGGRIDIGYVADPDEMHESDFSD